ncbi:MAG: hydroxymethylpyrimidine/phosphomethylpyrimidine kinase [Candidatus Cloacimonadales bacterium]
MSDMKFMMSIAASDNSGGAGIQQDLKVAERLGFWGLSTLTGVTVQDFAGLDLIYPLELDVIKQQFIKNVTTFPVAAIKIGALCSVEIANLIAELLHEYYRGIIVIDPVLAPTKGKEFISADDIKVYQQLLKQCTVVTPNKRELELLTNTEISDYPQAIETAKKLAQEYNCNVYVKGGHFSTSETTIEEYLVTPTTVTPFIKPRKEFIYSHGTGCFFASALSCFLANGLSLEMACQAATLEVSAFYEEVNQAF